MAVQDFHPDYIKYEPQWKACRDAAEGQYAIHKAGSLYLPYLSGQTQDEYNSYRARALFYEATGRTIQGLTGMIFRKPPEIEHGGMEDFDSDVTLDAMSLRGFAEDLTGEVMTVGRVGVLIEYPQAATAEMTLAQAQALNMRPYFVKFKTENIRNWKVGRINNQLKITEIRLSEIVEENSDDFDSVTIEQIRVLDLFNENYRVRIYRKDEKTAKWVQFEDDFFPIRNGAYMSEIPFVFISTNGTGQAVESPPLMGLVNINISHYRSTADLEHGAHFTGLPTAIITGIQADDAKGEFKIGSSTAWLFSNPDADAKYLEFTGQGLSALVERLTAKEGQMASLGAQMLAPDARRNESTDTASMRHMGENSILANIAQAISEGVNICLEVAAEWMGVAKSEIELNRDFSPTPMTPQMLTALVASWQSGAISTQTLFDNLKEGEVISHDKDFEEEQDEIQNGALNLPPVVS
jgi:hypothetical protein